jgi:hypothetical protein
MKPLASAFPRKRRLCWEPRHCAATNSHNCRSYTYEVTNWGITPEVAATSLLPLPDGKTYTLEARVFQIRWRSEDLSLFETPPIPVVTPTSSSESLSASTSSSLPLTPRCSDREDGE